MMYPGAYMSGAMAWWMVFWLVACAAVIAVLIVLVLRMDRPGTNADGARAKRLLDERLARGEIDAQETSRPRPTSRCGSGTTALARRA